MFANAKNKERMENRKRIIELLTAVRYTTNDIEKVADEICSLVNVSQQRELLIATIEKVRYNLDGYGALTSSEIAERLEKAINCC